MTDPGNAVSARHDDWGCTSCPDSRATRHRRRDRRSGSNPTTESTLPISVTSTHPTKDTTLIEVAGEIDMLTAPAVSNAVFAQLRTGHPESVILDLSGVTFFGVTGLCLLLDVREVAARYGTRLRLAQMPPPVSKVVNRAGLITVFDVAGPCVAAPSSGG